eukprot:4670214-Pleurochrysis_carterae.AAC.2
MLVALHSTRCVGKHRLRMRCRHLCSPRQSVPPHEELVLDPAVELLRLRLALHVEGVQGRRLEPDAYVVAEPVSYTHLTLPTILLV